MAGSGWQHTERWRWRRGGRWSWQRAFCAVAVAGLSWQGWCLFGAAPPNAFTPASPSGPLLAEVPRQFLALPQDTWLGPGWDVATVLVPRTGGREVHLNLMLDSGLTTSMLMPHVAKFLGLDSREGGTAQEYSFTAAGSAQRGSQVLVEKLQLADSGGLELGPVSPLVVDFAQSSIGQNLGCPIDGMLGMEFYERFGVEVGGDYLRLYEADQGSELARQLGMVHLSVASLPAKLLGVGVVAAGTPEAEAPSVLGVLDTGAVHTVLNWAAVETLYGMSQEAFLAANPDSNQISGVDISGRGIQMPIAKVQLELRGAGPEPCGAVALEEIEVAIGDIAILAKITRGDASQPAALLGQDLLVQRPMLLAARQRLLCFKD